MFKWLHRLFNPHCPDCMSESQDSRICPTCEVLKSQIESLRYEKNQLLNKLLNPTEPVETKSYEEEVKIQIPRTTPWHVRRQMLEAEDRKAAQLMRDKAVPVEDLEKELDLAAAAREAQ